MKAGSRAAFLAGILAVLALGVQYVTPGDRAPRRRARRGRAVGKRRSGGRCGRRDRRGAGPDPEPAVTACGVLLALTGPAILLAQLPAPDAGWRCCSRLRWRADRWRPSWPAAALACPVRRLRRTGWAIVALSLAVAGVIRGLLPAAVFDPRAVGCFSCASNLAEVHNDPALAAALEPWGLVLAIALGGCLAAGAGWRLLRAPRIVALINAPLVLGGMAVSLLEVAAAAYTLQLPTPEIDPTLRTCWLAQCCLIALMAAGVAVGGLRAPPAGGEDHPGRAHGGTRAGVAEGGPGRVHRRPGSRAGLPAR